MPNLPAHRERQAGTGLTEDTESELITTAKRICVCKALGSDAIRGLVMKTAALNTSGIFKATFSTCLREETFPAHRRVQMLVLLPKDGKPIYESSSYRLCMLDIAEKL